jgi:hypothetical protein
MAIIKLNRSQLNTTAVWEDPRAASNRIYLYQDLAFTKDTFDYKWNEGIQYASTTPGTFGVSVTYIGNATNQAYTGVLLLTGDTVHVNYKNTSTGNSRDHNIDYTLLTSMDPDRPARMHKYWEWDSANKAIVSQHFSWQWFDGYQYYIQWYNPSGELTNQPPNKNWYFDRLGLIPCYLSPSSGRLIGVFFNGTSNAYGRYQVNSGHIRDVFTGSGAGFTLQAVSALEYVSYQFIGVASNGQGLFLRNGTGSDHDQIIYRYDDSANTNTTLATINSAPSAAGTSAGGNRGTAYGSYTLKYSSKTFNDPTSAGNTGWYTPYLDVNGRYHPFWYQWNRTTDTFTRNADITVNWGATSQAAVWEPDSTIGGVGQDATVMQNKLLYNESFVVDGTRYLMLIQLGGWSAWDSSPKQRTFVTFSVDPANPKTLTYHSSVVIPTTPKNTIWLNDARTQLGVFSNAGFYIYNFTAASGWILTATLPYRFDAVGRDSLGRVWASDYGPLYYGRLHLITPSLPTTVSVSLAQASYNYTGTTINTTANVSAYDASGSRISAPVTLTVQGSSMRLVNTSNVEVTSLTVTTSASAEVAANVRVISSGTSQIVASVNF